MCNLCSYRTARYRDLTISLQNIKTNFYQGFVPDAEVGAVFDLDGAARPRRRRPVRFTDATARRLHSGGKLSMLRELLASKFCSDQCSANTNCRSDLLDRLFSKSCCKIMPFRHPCSQHKSNAHLIMPNRCCNSGINLCITLSK